MASSLIGALRVSLSADTAAFSKGMSQAEAKAKASSSAISKSLAHVRAGIAGLATGLMVGLFTDLIGQGLEYASSLGEIAQQLGVTSNTLQEFRYAASQTGISQEAMDKSLAKLTRSMGDAERGSKPLKSAFAELGISVDELRGKDAGEVMLLIADGLAKIPDAARRASLEATIFGRAGQQLDPLLSKGSAAVRDLTDAAHELGIVLSQESIEKADETADKLSAVNQMLKAKLASTVAENSDSILDLADALVVLVGGLSDAVRWLKAFRAQMRMRAAAMQGWGLAGPVPTKEGQAARAQYFRASLEQDFQNPGPDGKPKRKAKRRVVAAGVDDTEVEAGGGGRRGSGRGGKGDAERKARDAERAADDARRNTERFESDLARAQQRILSAEGQLADTAFERSEIEREQLSLDHEQALRDLAQDTDLTAARRAQLVALEEQNFTLQADLINKRENVRLEQEAADAVQARLDLEQEVLSSSAGMARTAADRRAIELRLLDLQRQEEEARLKTVTLRNGANQAEVDAAQARLGALPTIYGNREADVRRGTMGPIEEMLDKLPQSAAEANEAMEAVYAGGITSMIDGLADAATGARNLADVFKNVAASIIRDLIRIAIQRAVVNGLGQALGGIFGGGGGLVQAGGLLSSSEMASLPQLPQFANGGAFKVLGNRGIDTNLLSVNGKPAAWVNRGETISVDPNNNRSARDSRVMVVPSPYFDLVVDGRADGRVAAAAPGIASAGSYGAQRAIGYRQTRRVS